MTTEELLSKNRPYAFRESSLPPFTMLYAVEDNEGTQWALTESSVVAGLICYYFNTVTPSAEPEATILNSAERLIVTGIMASLTQNEDVRLTWMREATKAMGADRAWVAAAEKASAARRAAMEAGDADQR